MMHHTLHAMASDVKTRSKTHRDSGWLSQSSTPVQVPARRRRPNEGAPTVLTCASLCIWTMESGGFIFVRDEVFLINKRHIRLRASSILMAMDALSSIYSRCSTSVQPTKESLACFQNSISDTDAKQTYLQKRNRHGSDQS
jgi:hypothetical protein